MKTKTHEFTLRVKTIKTRKQTHQAVLTAFAIRQPDCCSFHLSNSGPTKLKKRITELEAALKGIANEDFGFNPMQEIRIHEAIRKVLPGGFAS